MISKELRSILHGEVLPNLFLKNPSVFYEAYKNGDESVHQMFMSLWAETCNRAGQQLDNNPLQLAIKHINIDYSEENHTDLMIVELPEIQNVSNMAVYCAVFFGVKQELRLFLGETDYNASGATRYIFIVELKMNELGYARQNHGFLFRGCNINPLLFDAPENPFDPDPMYGMEPEEEWSAFTDMVARICLLPLIKQGGALVTSRAQVRDVAVSQS